MEILGPVAEYITRRHNTVAQYISTRPILDIYMGVYSVARSMVQMQ